MSLNTAQEVERQLLDSYARSIVHLHRQFRHGRLALILGAGINKPFKLPNWADLVRRLGAAIPGGRNILSACGSNETMPFRTQLLFEHFRLSYLRSTSVAKRRDRDVEYTIVHAWNELVRTALYRGAPKDVAKVITQHPYLNELLRIITKTQMTVTYNFDDLLEKAISVDPDRGKEERENSRGYDTVTSLWGQFRLKSANIYHAHGYFPREYLETPRNRFVFGEASYAEEMIGIARGDQAGLLSHLSKNTCLLVGLSLGDEDLRSVLAQSAAANQGNFHYIVRFKDDSRRQPHKEYVDAACRTYFAVYNLIALHLSNAQIGALARLVRGEGGRLVDAAHAAKKPTAYRFYITGAIGTGKSTTVGHFTDLDVLDEWSQPRSDLMGVDPASLSSAERRQVDSFIDDQFQVKNDKLRERPIGTFLIDRGPLDPLAFTPSANWRARSEKLCSSICHRSGGQPFHVEPGHVIILTGDPEELAVRLTKSGRSLANKETGYDAVKLNKMQEALLKAYGKAGVTVIDTRGRAIAEVVKQVAQVIHEEPYVECDLHGRLHDFAK